MFEFVEGGSYQQGPVALPVQLPTSANYLRFVSWSYDVNVTWIIWSYCIYDVFTPFIKLFGATGIFWFISCRFQNWFIPMEFAWQYNEIKFMMLCFKEKGKGEGKKKGKKTESILTGCVRTFPGISFVSSLSYEVWRINSNFGCLVVKLIC